MPFTHIIVNNWRKLKFIRHKNARGNRGSEAYDNHLFSLTSLLRLDLELISNMKREYFIDDDCKDFEVRHLIVIYLKLSHIQYRESLGPHSGIGHISNNNNKTFYFPKSKYL